MMSYEAFLDEYERESNARLIDRIVLKPNPGGPGGKKRGPETRVDVYLTGATKPYRPTYAKGPAITPLTPEEVRETDLQGPRAKDRRRYEREKAKAAAK